MFSLSQPFAAAARVICLGLLVGAVPVHAARIGVLSNKNAQAVATDFGTRISAHTFTAIDVSTTTPAAAALLEQFDVILLFEDGLFEGSQAVGNVVFQFAQAGHPVVLGTFYDQDRSDRTLGSLGAPHGWGNLESIDPNTSDGLGTAYAARTLDPASIVVHPLTKGVSTLFADSTLGYAGGNQAKPGTRVLAAWTQKNLNAATDPAIALRASTGLCVMQIGIAPDYSAYGALGTAYGGDFYQVWKNAFDYGAGNCGAGFIVPTLGAAPLAALGLLMLMFAAARLRRRVR